MHSLAILSFGENRQLIIFINKHNYIKSACFVLVYILYFYLIPTSIRAGIIIEIPILQMTKLSSERSSDFTKVI